MAQLFSNNALTVSSTALTSFADQTISVRTGTGDLFPNIINPEDYFLITLEDAKGSKREVISITARNGDVLTIGSRGVENTRPIADWPIGTIIELRLTAGFLNSQNSALHVLSNQIQSLSASTEALSNQQNDIIQNVVDEVQVSNAILMDVETKIDDSNTKLDAAISVLQQQLAALQASGGEQPTLNTEVLESILDTLIILKNKPVGRFDVSGRTVIDASETLVKLDNTTPFAVSGSFSGTTIGTTTYSNALDVFSTTRILYNQISVS